MQQIGAGSPLRLTTDPSNDYNPVWSPDGRWIAFLRSQSEGGKSELRLIPPLGGPERKVAEIRVREVFVTPPYLAWCPDSNCLVVTDSPGEGKPVALFVVSLETGEKRQLTHPQPPATGDTHPAVSPDGSWLVFRRNASGLFTGELYRLPLGRGLTAVGEPQRLTPAALDADYPTWMPDSKEILFSAKGSLWRLVVARRKHAGAPAFRRRGRNDAGGFAPPARAAASSGLRSQFRGLQYLARRDLCSRRDGLLAACRRYLLHETGRHAPAFSRRPPGGLCIGSLGRMGNLAGRS